MLKWGGELTQLGINLAEVAFPSPSYSPSFTRCPSGTLPLPPSIMANGKRAGHVFREEMYTEGDGADLGLLRLHSTYCHDLKVVQVSSDDASLSS